VAVLYGRLANMVMVRGRDGVMAMAWVGVRVKILFCSSIEQFPAFRIMQPQNGYGVKIRVRISG